VTHGVVTPNIVAARRGFDQRLDSAASGLPAAIPITARAALARIFAEILLMPATSTTEYMSVMSFVST